MLINDSSESWSKGSVEEGEEWDQGTAEAVQHQGNSESKMDLSALRSITCMYVWCMYEWMYICIGALYNLNLLSCMYVWISIRNKKRALYILGLNRFTVIIIKHDVHESRISWRCWSNSNSYMAYVTVGRAMTPSPVILHKSHL